MADAGYDPSTDVGMVRLLLSDVSEPYVFADNEVTAFLTMEGGDVKLAAAQAIDVNATNELLASKVLRSQDVSTDGAKLADAMRKHAAELRRQAREDDDAEGFFDVVEAGPAYAGAELTERRSRWPLGY